MPIVLQRFQFIWYKASFQIYWLFENGDHIPPERQNKISLRITNKLWQNIYFCLYICMWFKTIWIYLPLMSLFDYLISVSWVGFFFPVFQIPKLRVNRLPSHKSIIFNVFCCQNFLFPYCLSLLLEILNTHKTLVLEELPIWTAIRKASILSTA